MPNRRKFPQLWEDGWLFQEYVVKKRSMEEIAASVGATNVSGVLRAMRALGVQSRGAAESRILRGTASRRRFHQLEDEAWLRECYLDKQMTMEEMGASIGCSRIPVHRALRAFGIQPLSGIRGGKTRSDIIPQLRDMEWLQHQYLDLGKSPTAIAAEIGCSAWTVSTRLSDMRIRRKVSLAKEPAGQVKRPMSSGYIGVYMPEHPDANIRGFVLEHRLIAAEALGRPLLKKEEVHHLNVNRTDNREDNFLVFKGHSEHSRFHQNPPAWIPRCECCGRPAPERLERRPADVPLEWEP